MSALDELTQLLANLPGAALLTDDMKNRALAGAVVPDSLGVWPGLPGYEATYDIYYAAMGLIGFLQAQPVVRSTSSEGTSISVDAPSWSALLAWYQSMSPISAATGGQVLSTIPIPSTRPVVRTDMSGRYDGNDNVDTDLD